MYVVFGEELLDTSAPSDDLREFCVVSRILIAVWQLRILSRVFAFWQLLLCSNATRVLSTTSFQQF